MVKSVENNGEVLFFNSVYGLLILSILFIFVIDLLKTIFYYGCE